MTLLGWYFECILRGQMRAGIFNVLRLAAPLGNVLGLVLLRISGNLHVASVIYLQLVLSALTLGAAIFFVGQLSPLRGWRLDLQLIRELIMYGARAHLGYISTLANLRLDQIALTAFASPVQIGLYAVAVSAASVIQAISLGLSLVIMPKVARESGSGRRATVFRPIYQLYSVVSIFITPLYAILVLLLLPVVYGDDFSPAIGPAVILVFGGWFLGGRAVLSAGLRGFGEPWQSSRSDLAAFVVTVILLGPLLSLWGVLGAAITSLIAYAVAFIILFRSLQRLGAVETSDIARFSGIRKLFTNL